MNVIQFLLQHLDTILTLLSIVAVLVLGLVYITKNGRNFINAMLLSFVTIAEKRVRRRDGRPEEVAGCHGGL